MNELVAQEENLENMIYNIRGQEVMLDSDLAKLFQCTNGTKDINKAVKRNNNRFPEDFYFQLTKKEYELLKFQNGTSKVKRGGIRKLPYVFTEHGTVTVNEGDVLYAKMYGGNSNPTYFVLILK